MAKKGDNKQFINAMVEALIAGDSDKAADELHNYLQVKTRAMIVGEAASCENEEEADDDDDDDDEKKDDDKDDKKGKKGKKAKPFEKKDKKDDDDDDDDDDDEKEEVKESSTNPHANLTKAKGPKWAKENVNKGKVEGNFLKKKPKKSNDTRAKAGLDKHSNHGDTSTKGNVYKNKPHKENLTKAKGPNWAKENVNKGKVEKFDDGREFDMGTGNV